GGREIHTANAFKNALGTYPGGWRVPLTYRRDGHEHEIVVRLANFHRAGELDALLQSEQGPPEPDQPPGPPRAGQPPGGQPRRGGPQPPDPDGRRPNRGPGRGGAEAEIPAAVKPFFEKRTSYAN